MSRFKKLVLEMIAFSMSSNQISQMREEFNTIDRDRSGTISMQELRNSLAAMGGGATLPENFEEIFHSVDVDNSAEINYNEFVAAAMCRRITIDEEKLMLAFETLDVDNTGAYLTQYIACEVCGHLCGGYCGCDAMADDVCVLWMCRVLNSGNHSKGPGRPYVGR
jgi:hypothetical protein